jgi:hypothetical protein
MFRDPLPVGATGRLRHPCSRGLLVRLGAGLAFTNMLRARALGYSIQPVFTLPGGAPGKRSVQSRLCRILGLSATR